MAQKFNAVGQFSTDLQYPNKHEIESYETQRKNVKDLSIKSELEINVLELIAVWLQMII